jgi:hypothetical protein
MIRQLVDASSDVFLDLILRAMLHAGRWTVNSLSRTSLSSRRELALVTASA